MSLVVQIVKPVEAMWLWLWAIKLILFGLVSIDSDSHNFRTYRIKNYRRSTVINIKAEEESYGSLLIHLAMGLLTCCCESSHTQFVLWNIDKLVHTQSNLTSSFSVLIKRPLCIFAVEFTCLHHLQLNSPQPQSYDLRYNTIVSQDWAVRHLEQELVCLFEVACH